MNGKKIDALTGIAAMIRDRELADLARLNLERKRLEDEVGRIQQNLRTARQDATENIMLALASESFAGWAQGQEQKLRAQIATLQPLIEMKKKQAALAVGRQRNLTEMAQNLLEQSRKKSARPE